MLHPFAAVAPSKPFVLHSGSGSWVVDEGGRRYLDATSSLWYCNVGHGRTEIVDAVAKQMRELESYSCFGDLATRPALELAERLEGIAPMPARCFFTTGGGEAVDTAAKIARRHWQAQGQTERQHLISRRHAYHGTNGLGTALGGIPANRTGFGDLDQNVSQIVHDSAAALEKEIVRIGAENVAAFFVEPVIGAGGVRHPPDGYLREVRGICDRFGVLLVADEVICGFGRLGEWFGVQRWGIVPDLICFAKGVTSGYLPLGGVLVSERVLAPLSDERAGALRHGATYAGHAACCAAALANLDIVEREQLLGRAVVLERELERRLRPLEDLEAVAEVRAGTGVMAAVHLSAETLEREPQAAARAATECRAAGVLVRPLGDSLAVSPPLIVDHEELDMIADRLMAVLMGNVTVPGTRRT